MTLERIIAFVQQHMPHPSVMHFGQLVESYHMSEFIGRLYEKSHRFLSGHRFFDPPFLKLRNQKSGSDSCAASTQSFRNMKPAKQKDF